MHAAIITIQGDLHAFAVKKALADRHECTCDIIEADSLADTGGLNWSPDEAIGRGTLPAHDGSLVDIQGLDVIWWRRYFYDKAHIPVDVSDPVAIEVINGDCRVSAIGALLCDFHGAWISHPEATRRAENKLVQLQAARRAGFCIPKTLVSQNPTRIREFAAALGGRVVVKSLVNSHQAALTPTVVDADVLSSDRALRLSPAIYQEVVPGHRHLRVHGFGGAFHAALITCEELDWRYNLAHSTIEKYLLPLSVVEQLRRFMRLLDLRMGVFDLKITPAGEIVWFEVNPQGQFLFVEGLSDLAITQHFVDFIANEAASHRADA